MKPDKCFFHLLDFAWTKKGGWQYIAHHEDETAVITVPMPDGTMASIKHGAVDNAQKMLVVVTCPSGNSMGSLQQMREKTQKWLDSLTAGRLHCRMMWFSVGHQLWPLVKYGLCCSMAALPELETVLLPFYGKMLLLSGVVCKANRGIQQLDQGFYGAGFPHPGIKYCRKIKQAPHALWMSHSPGVQAANIAGTSCGGSWIIISTFLHILQTLWRMGDNLLAKKSLGEG